MLTQDQIQHYQSRGWLLVSGLLDVAEVDVLERAFDEIVARRLAARASLDATWGGEKWKEQLARGDTVVLHTHDVQVYSAAWARVLTHERLTQAMADLIGPNVQLHHTKLFQKPPERGSAFPMHQDYHYFPHARHSMTAAVIHLSNADLEMGCIRVIPGSHRLGPLPPFEHLHLNPAEYPIDKATPCPARRGDVLFFNYLTIHGSGLNTSPRTRKTVLIQFRDPADPPTKDMHRSHAQGMMLRGVNPLTAGGTAEGTLEKGDAAVRH